MLSSISARSPVLQTPIAGTVTGGSCRWRRDERLRRQDRPVDAEARGQRAGLGEPARPPSRPAGAPTTRAGCGSRRRTATARRRRGTGTAACTRTSRAAASRPCGTRPVADRQRGDRRDPVPARARRSSSRSRRPSRGRRRAPRTSSASSTPTTSPTRCGSAYAATSAGLARGAEAAQVGGDRPVAGRGERGYLVPPQLAACPASRAAGAPPVRCRSRDVQPDAVDVDPSPAPLRAVHGGEQLGPGRAGRVVRPAQVTRPRARAPRDRRAPRPGSRLQDADRCQRPGQDRVRRGRRRTARGSSPRPGPPAGTARRRRPPRSRPAGAGRTTGSSPGTAADRRRGLRRRTAAPACPGRPCPPWRRRRAARRRAGRRSRRPGRATGWCRPRRRRRRPAPVTTGAESTTSRRCRSSMPAITAIPVIGSASIQSAVGRVAARLPPPSTARGAAPAAPGPASWW